MKAERVKTVTGYKNIDIELISAPAVAVRFEVSDESVADLVESIKKIGLIEPVIVRSEKGKFEIVAGHRRLTACRLAGLKKVKCIVVDVSDDESEVIKMHENHMRLNISPVEQAVYFSYLVQTKMMKQSEIAEMLGVSEGFVSQRLAVMGWNEQLVTALDGGQISFSAARELARITEESALLVHLRQAVEHGVTPRVANIWWQDWLKSKGVDMGGEKGSGVSQETPAGQDTNFVCSICQNSFSYRNMTYLRLCGPCGRLLEDVASKPKL